MSCLSPKAGTGATGQGAVAEQQGLSLHDAKLELKTGAGWHSHHSSGLLDMPPHGLN